MQPKYTTITPFECTLRQAVFHYFDKEDDLSGRFDELIYELDSDIDIMKDFAFMLVEELSRIAHSGAITTEAVSHEFH